MGNKEKLNQLTTLLTDILKDAPDEENSSKEENEFYFDVVNLLRSVSNMDMECFK